MPVEPLHLMRTPYGEIVIVQDFELEAKLDAGWWLEEKDIPPPDDYWPDDVPY